MKKLYTIGHSNKTIELFIEKLINNKINVLVDVRSIPYSKYNPQFNREFMKNELIKSGIVYVYRGKNLGGLKMNENWEEAIDELCEKVDNKNIVVMCSEADPNNCHRKSTIQPAIEKKGVEVEHILWPLSPTKQKEFDRRKAKEEERKEKERIKPSSLFI